MYDALRNSSSLNYSSIIKMGGGIRAILVKDGSSRINLITLEEAPEDIRKNVMEYEHSKVSEEEM